MEKVTFAKTKDITMRYYEILFNLEIFTVKMTYLYAYLFFPIFSEDRIWNLLH